MCDHILINPQTRTHVCFYIYTKYFNYSTRNQHYKLIQQCGKPHYKKKENRT